MTARLDLLPFQRRFLAAALRPSTRIAALSLPRGNGKSTLAAYIAQRLLTPGDPLHVPGTESHIIAASLGQSRRTTFKLLRQLFENIDDYKIADNQNDSRVYHKPSKTIVSVLAANYRTAQGLVDVPLVICDEPGSWDTTGGLQCWEAIEGALRKPTMPGKPRMRILAIGTLGPALDGWWHDMIRGGSTRTTYVQALIGDRDKWDSLRELRRVNPLVARYPEQWRELRDLLDKSRRDSREKSAFITRHLNQPTPDEGKALLTLAEWDLCLAREAPPRVGRPVVGLDMGGGRAWSSAVGMWPNGRVEAIALAPGFPDIQEQERRDIVPRGTYQKLVDAGLLIQATGYHSPPVGMLLDAIKDWRPLSLTSDRFRADDVMDARPPCRVIFRAMMPSEKSQDIRALRRMSSDGPIAPAPESRSLLEASLAVAVVAHDKRGNVELVKSGNNNCSRDDVAAALVLAAGAFERRPRPRKLRVI